MLQASTGYAVAKIPLIAPWHATVTALQNIDYTRTTKKTALENKT